MNDLLSIEDATTEEIGIGATGDDRSGDLDVEFEQIQLAEPSEYRTMKGSFAQI